MCAMRGFNHSSGNEMELRKIVMLVLVLELMQIIIYSCSHFSHSIRAMMKCYGTFIRCDFCFFLFFFFLSFLCLRCSFFAFFRSSILLLFYLSGHSRCPQHQTLAQPGEKERNERTIIIYNWSALEFSMNWLRWHLSRSAAMTNDSWHGRTTQCSRDSIPEFHHFTIQCVFLVFDVSLENMKQKPNYISLTVTTISYGFIKLGLTHSVTSFWMLNFNFHFTFGCGDRGV